MDNIKETKKELLKLRRELRSLSDAILFYLSEVDEIFMRDKTIPDEVGRKFARLSNKLDFKNDSVRHFALHLGISKKDKERAVAKIRKSAGPDLKERKNQ